MSRPYRVYLTRLVCAFGDKPITAMIRIGQKNAKKSAFTESNPLAASQTTFRTSLIGLSFILLKAIVISTSACP